MDTNSGSRRSKVKMSLRMEPTSAKMRSSGKVITKRSASSSPKEKPPVATRVMAHDQNETKTTQKSKRLEYLQGASDERWHEANTRQNARQRVGAAIGLTFQSGPRRGRGNGGRT